MLRSGYLVLGALLVLACAAPTPVPSEDASGMDAGVDAYRADLCHADRDCDDGAFCTGVERCAPTEASADARGCATSPPCGTSDLCDEAADRCVAGCVVDSDGDGSRALACGGGDCDDADPNRFPGNPEVCDTAGHDEDCDLTTYGFRDVDGDDHPAIQCCNGSGAELLCGDDCNDMAAGVHPDAPETCDARDNDCDTAIDEDGLSLYLDCDGDGFGNSSVGRIGCPAVVTATADCPAPTASSTWTTTPGDCDDVRAATHPGAAEQCNGIDDDCMLPTDPPPPTCSCTAGATTACGYDSSCHVVNGSCVSGAFDCPPGLRTGAEAEVCDGIDNNCNGVVDEGCPCMPVGRTRTCATMHVGACATGSETCSASGFVGCPSAATEVCSSVDEDCDGTNDENLHTWSLALSVSGTDTCDRVGAAHTCARRISDACRAGAAPSGRCGANAGYGAVDLVGDSMTVMCLADVARFQLVPTGTLQAQHPSCTPDDANYSACKAAINRYCASMGFVGGFGYPDSFTTFTVNCVSSSQGQAFTGEPWSELTAVQPGCVGPTPNTVYCPNAVHRWCQAHGFASGFGTVEHNASVVSFFCVRAY